MSLFFDGLSQIKDDVVDDFQNGHAVDDIRYSFFLRRRLGCFAVMVISGILLRLYSFCHLITIIISIIA